MKNLIGVVMPLVAFAAAARKPAAAVTISGTEQPRFFLFGTGDTGPLAELGKTLKRRRYAAAELSAWTRKLDPAAVAADLEKHDIKLKNFYLLAPKKPDYHRLDFVAAADPEPAEPPPDELAIRELPIENNAYNRKHKLPGKFKEVKFITIHNTAEPFSARQERDRVDFRRNGVSVSFHFAVDENEAVQLLPLDLHGWHAGDGRGDGNTKSIGIEICRSQCRGASDWRYRRAEANAVKLAARLLRQYRLTADALRMHRDWSGKYCPHRILEADSWEDFRARVRQRLDSEEK